MKHPNRTFKSPEALLARWNEYKAYRDEEAVKWAKIQYVGKDGERVQDNPPMPYTLDGFFVWHLDKYGKHVHQYFKRTEELFPEFLPIITRIIAERDDNIKTGVLTGHFNASIGIRITGLVDKKETEVKGEPRIFNID